MNALTILFVVSLSLNILFSYHFNVKNIRLRFLEDIDGINKKYIVDLEEHNRYLLAEFRAFLDKSQPDILNNSSKDNSKQIH